jgi:enoyl-CoA hydratase/carnithine racemase
MGFVDISYEKKDGIAIITFIRQEARNAVRQQTWIDLSGALKNIRDDDGVRAAVITGRGKAFSAGADLAEMAAIMGTEVDLFEVRRGLLGIQEITRQMVDLPKPIVAALNGYAVGAGAEIAIASDIRIASEKATFEFAEVKVGLFETNGVTYLLPRIIGHGRARELMLTGRRIDASEAWSIGLVSQVVAPESLMDETVKIAEQMTAHAPVSMALVKECLNKSGEIALADALVYETEAMMACAMTKDAREGATAFMEKRKPRFIGR